MWETPGVMWDHDSHIRITQGCLKVTWVSHEEFVVGSRGSRVGEGVTGESRRQLRLFLLGAQDPGVNRRH